MVYGVRGWKLKKRRDGSGVPLGQRKSARSLIMIMNEKRCVWMFTHGLKDNAWNQTYASTIRMRCFAGYDAE